MQTISKQLLTRNTE